MTRQFYTQQGWEGKEYTRNLSTTAIAKLVRTEARKKYPSTKGYKISVTREYFSMGSSITVKVRKTPFPLYELGEVRELVPMSDKMIKQPVATQEHKALLVDLKAIGNKYNYSDCDGMIDYFDVNFWLHVDIDHELDTVEKYRVETPEDLIKTYNYYKERFGADDEMTKDVLVIINERNIDGVTE